MTDVTAVESPAYTPRYQIPDFRKVLDDLEDRVRGVTIESEMLPGISPRDFDNLVDSISKFGLTDPIKVNKALQLLDGRSRLMACHVLNIQLSKSQVVRSAADAEAVADANYARRHLTVDQLAMYAADKLKIESVAAAKRKKIGGMLGRQARSDKLLVTESVTSQTKPKTRTPRAIDVIAKSEGVPRERLRRAQQLVATDAALAKDVKDGKLTLKVATKKASIRQQSRESESVGSGQSTESKRSKGKKLLKLRGLYRDDLIKILERPNKIQVVTTEFVTIYQHPRAKFSCLVRLEGQTWVAGRTDSADSERSESRSDAEAISLALMQSFVGGNHTPKLSGLKAMTSGALVAPGS